MITLLIVVFIVLISSAICSGTEAALFSTPMVKVRQLADGKDRGASALLAIRESMGRPISMIVILNNVANIVGSMVIGVLATGVFGSQWMGLFSAVITLLVIIFSEIIPKTLGELHNEKIALFVASPVLFLTKCLLPLIWLVELLTSPFTRGASPGFSTNEKEIRYLAQIGEEEGAIEQDELEMIQGVFKLNDITASQLMTPRVALTCMDNGRSLNAMKDEILASQHSRIVITGSSRDDVKGVALKSELLAALVRGHGEQNISKYMYCPLEVSQHIKADELLPMFQSERQHLAIVRDEFNGVAGVVTLEDVVEELTGEIIDETDTDDDMREASPTV